MVISLEGEREKEDPEEQRVRRCFERKQPLNDERLAKCAYSKQQHLFCCVYEFDSADSADGSNKLQF